MSDTPQKPLSLKRKKRIIRRDQLPNVRAVSKPKQPPTNRKNKTTRKAQNPSPRPSDEKAKALNQRLMAFAAWKEFRPLAIGVEKSIFRLCNDEAIPGASKNVIQKTLKRHTNQSIYQRNIIDGEVRYELDGQKAGEILPMHQEIARRKLSQRDTD